MCIKSACELLNKCTFQYKNAGPFGKEPLKIQGMLAFSNPILQIVQDSSLKGFSTNKCDGNTQIISCLFFIQVMLFRWLNLKQHFIQTMWFPWRHTGERERLTGQSEGTANSKCILAQKKKTAEQTVQRPASLSMHIYSGVSSVQFIGIYTKESLHRVQPKVHVWNMYPYPINCEGSRNCIELNRWLKLGNTAKQYIRLKDYMQMYCILPFFSTGVWHCTENKWGK